MISATDLRNGATFLDNKKPYQVVKYVHQKIARGGGTVKLSVRNLETGTLEEKNLSSSTKLVKIDTSKRKLQYLFQDAYESVFMDPKTYEQVSLSTESIRDKLLFLKEGEEVNVLFWDEKPLSIEIPAKVVLEVIDTAPGVKGNSATNIYKRAKLENGLSIKVPLFIKKGQKVRVDTRTQEYVEREE